MPAPTSEEVAAIWEQAREFLRQLIGEAEARLPEGLTLTDEDFTAILDQVIGRFGADWINAWKADLWKAVLAGKGPNKFDQSFLA